MNVARGARFDPEASALMISTETTGMDDCSGSAMLRGLLAGRERFERALVAKLIGSLGRRAADDRRVQLERVGDLLCS